MRPTTLRVATTIILIAEAAVVLYGLLLLLGPADMLGAGFERFAGPSWDALRAQNSDTADYIAMLGRVLGALNVAFGVMGCAVALGALRRGTAWAWYALLVGNTFGYGGPVAYDLTVRSITVFEKVEMVLIVLVYVALALCARDVLGRRSSPLTSAAAAAADPAHGAAGAAGPPTASLRMPRH